MFPWTSSLFLHLSPVRKDPVSQTQLAAHWNCAVWIRCLSEAPSFFFFISFLLPFQRRQREMYLGKSNLRNVLLEAWRADDAFDMGIEREENEQMSGEDGDAPHQDAASVSKLVFIFLNETSTFLLSQTVCIDVKRASVQTETSTLIFHWTRKLLKRDLFIYLTKKAVFLIQFYRIYILKLELVVLLLAWYGMTLNE